MMTQGPTDNRRLAGMAVMGVSAVNLAASLALLLLLRPGTLAGGGVTDRMTYIVTNRFVWTAGWLLWVLAALSLVGLFYVLSAHLDSRMAGLLRYARALAVLGAAPDIIANLINAGVLADMPARWLAASPAVRPVVLEEFAVWDRFAVLLTGGLANLLYGLAGALLTAAMFRTAHFPRLLAWGGAVVWGMALAMSVAGFAVSPAALEPTVGATMALFIAWSFAVGYVFLYRRGGPPATRL
ncbi:MAG: hypothetical protein Q7T26_07590 [Dehalococcoidia bacterium]|nr:hypothetical protein [Dehalococcoidia bacterium]